MGLLVSKHILARSYLLYLPFGLGLIFKINFQAQIEAFWFLTMTELQAPASAYSFLSASS